MAKLMLGNANFLILDEPTNHLDIASKEILEDALNSYEGTVLYVSHDRYFINRTAHRILDLTAQRFVNYIGNYDYYLEKHDAVMAAVEAVGIAGASQAGAASGTGAGGDRLTSVSSSAAGADRNGSAASPGESLAGIADSGASAKPAESDAKQDWLAKKEEQARTRKKENDLKKCEEKIAALEDRNAEIDALLSDPAIGTQVARLQELTTEQAELQETLEQLYAEWEVLAE